LEVALQINREPTFSYNSILILYNNKSHFWCIIVKWGSDGSPAEGVHPEVLSTAKNLANVQFAAGG